MNVTRTPTAPKKKSERRSLPYLENIRRRLFPDSPKSISPPHAPKKRNPRRRKPVEAIPLVWEEKTSFNLEGQVLRESGEVREKYLLHRPEEVASEDDVQYLEMLWELYFPLSQPRSLYEEAYQKCTRDAIDRRLSELTHLSQLSQLPKC